MFIHLTVAAGLVLTSGGMLPETFKDVPPRYAYRERPATSEFPPALPPVPGRNISYVFIKGGGDVRLPMSQEEMERYGYVQGQVITLQEARRIVEEKLIRRERGQ